MTFDAYKLFNLSDFEATGLVSQKMSVILEGLGAREILITKGNRVSILYEGVFLSVSLLSKNPFVFDGYAAFADPDGYVWLGVANED